MLHAHVVSEEELQCIVLEAVVEDILRLGLVVSNIEQVEAVQCFLGSVVEDILQLGLVVGRTELAGAVDSPLGMVCWIPFLNMAVFAPCSRVVEH